MFSILDAFFGLIIYFVSSRIKDPIIKLLLLMLVGLCFSVSLIVFVLAVIKTIMLIDIIELYGLTQ